MSAFESKVLKGAAAQALWEVQWKVDALSHGITASVRPRRERVAIAIFGTWRERPRLPQEKIEAAWDAMDPAFQAAWLETADFALEAAGGAA